jgi:hypothetical protein
VDGLEVIRASVEDAYMDLLGHTGALHRDFGGRSGLATAPRIGTDASARASQTADGAGHDGASQTADGARPAGAAPVADGAGPGGVA